MAKIVRSIPVGTGNPPARRSRRRSAGVYPRGHGESKTVTRRPKVSLGLSPWARGIP